jgi:NAD(P)-dependent dehydrogenase (short-subunit alcohol dehydrogenase family)
MLQQGSGAIVNAASALGLVGNGNAPYVASKHGVVGLTKSAAISYAQAGVRVNAIAPGYITTPMTAPIYSDNPAAAAELAARHPIGRMGTPQEVAEAVIWLCSPAASFVTGHTLSVDGGYVVR